MSDGAAPDAPRRTRTWPQRALLVFSCMVIVASVAAAGGLLYLYSKVSNIGRVPLGTSLAAPPSSGAPENFLIVGTDSADGLDPNDPVLVGRPPGIRSDTIMVVRTDPRSGTAAILSLPRDLYVPIAGLGGSDRINAAVQGGPQRLVATITQDFGIPINHYVEINFAAFHKIVDAVDGVPVYFSYPTRDLKSGLEVDNPGCVTLDGTQALAFVRSRDFEQHIGNRWSTDPTGDLGRITRQQDFIKKVLHRAIDKGARNPAVLDQLVNGALASVHLDPTLTPGDLLGLARQFAGFNPDTLTTYSVPATDATIHGAAVLRVSTAAAEPIFQRFRDVQGAINPDSLIVVGVNNGTARPDIGQQAATALRTVGFTVPTEQVGDLGRYDWAQTTVWYAPGHEADARRVASHFLGGAKVEAAQLPLTATDVLVILGADFQGVDTAADKDTTPSTTNSVPPDTASAAAVTTTTAQIGVVPEATQDSSC